MKIAIAGAGGMGCRFAFMLQKAGVDLYLIDSWLPHVEKIQKEGLLIHENNQTFTQQFDIYTPETIPHDKKQVDLVIAFTKATQLNNMFQKISPILRNDTRVLCLLNGLGHEEVLEKYVKKENILLGMTLWTAALPKAGEVQFSGGGEVEFQSLSGSNDPFANQVAALFEKAGLNPKHSQAVFYSIWKKACVNGVENALCTLLECTVGQLGAGPQTEAMVTSIVSEFAKVAAKENVFLDQGEIHDYIKQTYLPTHAGNHYPSMYQDLILHNRLTEIDYINGAVVKKAQRYHLEVPVCQLITQLIHTKEFLLKAK